MNSNMENKKLFKKKIMEILAMFLVGAMVIGITQPLKATNISEEKKKQQDPVLKTNQADQRPPKKVKHSKYGYGVIISEDDIMIKVVFEDYGEKDLMKAFTALEYPDS